MKQLDEALPDVVGQLLGHLLSASTLELSNHFPHSLQLVTNLRHFSESRVYALEICDQDLYFQHFLKAHQESLQTLLRDLISDKEEKVIEDMDNIHQEMRDAQDHHARREAHRLRRNLLGHDQEKSRQPTDSTILEFQSVMNPKIDPNPSTFRTNLNRVPSASTDLPKIRQFLQSIQQKQRKVKQKIQRSYQLQAKHKQILKQQLQEIRQNERKQRIRVRREKQEQKRRQREREREESASKEEEFKGLIGKLNRYPKPLFEIKQEKFKQQEISEIQEMKLRVRERKMKVRPIDGEELVRHQQDYEKRKAELELQRVEKMERIMAERDHPTPERLFKGQFYRVTTEKDAEDDAKDRAYTVRERISNFNQMVRENYKPKIDNKKRIQVLNYLEFEREREKVKSSMSSYGNPKKQDSRALGNKYLDQLKRLTPQLRTPSKKPKTSRTQNSSLHPIQQHSQVKKPQFNSYLHQGITKLKLRANPTSWRRDIESSELSQMQKYQTVLLKSGRLQEEALKKQKHLMMESKRGAKALQMAESIDEYMINSIEAKLQLITKLGTK